MFQRDIVQRACDGKWLVWQWMEWPFTANDREAIASPWQCIAIKDTKEEAVEIAMQ